jgi:cobalt-zinc-cadmium efflux system protein
MFAWSIPSDILAARLRLTSTEKVGHAHNHASSIAGKRLAASIFITLAFVVAETIAGFFSHSLALLSDAGHNFADALALLLSWYGIWIARKPSTQARTFGYHRVGIFAALVNAVSLVVIAILIFWEAANRLGHPAPVHGTPMIAVALVAIVINGGISYWLRRDAKRDISVRSAYLHTLGDAISAAGVVAAGLVIVFAGTSIADPIVSVLIGLLILWSSWGILQESLNVLLEAIPKGMKMDEVEQTIAGVSGVLAVHDLHVWTIGSGIIACSCHITVGEQSIRSGQDVLRAVNGALEQRFGISHSTIQIEVEGCDPNDMYCIARAATHD